MSTLHQYRWQDIKQLIQFLPMLHEGDSLVIYGTLNKSVIDAIHKLLEKLDNNWYIVSASGHQIRAERHIDYDEWLTLLINHHNSLTWK